MVFILDCSQTDTKLEWKSAKNTSNYERSYGSVCMVDNDRFIAIIGAADSLNSKHVELFPVDRGVCIPVKDMNVGKSKGFSEYNSKYHNIITCGKVRLQGMEKYDIWKNEWMMLKKILPLERVIEMFIDDDNPNIVHMIGVTGHHCYDSFKGYQIDMRMDENNGWMEIFGDNEKLVSFAGSGFDKFELYDNICCLRL